jgi:hypothetical protein
MFGPKRDEVETGGHFIMRNSVIYASYLVGGWVSCHSVSQFVSFLTQWGRVFLQLTFTQVVKKFPSF